jgi:hypothetical protein
MKLFFISFIILLISGNAIAAPIVLSENQKIFFTVNDNKSLVRTFLFPSSENNYYTITLAYEKNNNSNDIRPNLKVTSTTECKECIFEKYNVLNKTLDIYTREGINNLISVTFPALSVEALRNPKEYSIKIEKKIMEFDISNSGLELEKIKSPLVSIANPVSLSLNSKKLIISNFPIPIFDPLMNEAGSASFQDLRWSYDTSLKVSIDFDHKPQCIQELDNSKCKKQIISKIMTIASQWTKKNALNLTLTDSVSNSIDISVLITNKLPQGLKGVSCIGNLCKNSLYGMKISTDFSGDDRTILHEFGHALGLEHENVNPNFILDTKKLYDYCKSINIDETMCKKNYLLNGNEKKFDYSQFDNKSVMLYPIPKNIMKDSSLCSNKENTKIYCDDIKNKISDIDIKYMNSYYPIKDKKISYSIACDTSLSKSQTCLKNQEPCIVSPDQKYGFIDATKKINVSLGKNNKCDIKLSEIISNTKVYNKICYSVQADIDPKIKNSKGLTECTITATMKSRFN